MCQILVRLAGVVHMDLAIETYWIWLLKLFEL